MAALQGRTDHRPAHLAGEIARVNQLSSLRAIREIRGLNR
jgi:hypothetical protein